MADGDSHLRAAVFDGVAKQVLEHGREPTLVGRHFSGAVDRQRRVTGVDPGPRLLGEWRHRDERRVADVTPVAGEGQHVVDQLFHPVECVRHPIEPLFVALACQLQPAVCDRQRVPEVVADDRGELFEPFVLTAELPLLAPSLHGTGDQLRHCLQQAHLLVGPHPAVRVVEDSDADQLELRGEHRRDDAGPTRRADQFLRARVGAGVAVLDRLDPSSPDEPRLVVAGGPESGGQRRSVGGPLVCLFVVVAVREVRRCAPDSDELADRLEGERHLRVELVGTCGHQARRRVQRDLTEPGPVLEVIGRLAGRRPTGLDRVANPLGQQPDCLGVAVLRHVVGDTRPEGVASDLLAATGSEQHERQRRVTLAEFGEEIQPVSFRHVVVRDDTVDRL